MKDICSDDKLGASKEGGMKKIFVLTFLSLFCLQAVILFQSPVYAAQKKAKSVKKYAGQLKGGEAGIGEYLNLGGLDVKVVNWGFVSNIPLNDPSKYYYINRDYETALEVDIVMKNPSKNTVTIWPGIYKPTLIAKDERAYAKYPQFNQYRQSDQTLNTQALPGQPVYASIFFPVEKNMGMPAKMVLIAQDNTVARFFLQRNLPDEEIPGTTHIAVPAVPVPQQQQAPAPDNSLGQEIKNDAVNTTKDEIKEKAHDIVKENVKNFLGF